MFEVDEDKVSCSSNEGISNQPLEYEGYMNIDPLSIRNEMMNIYRELSYEFSQSQWEDALIYGFRRDLSMAGVIARASGIDGNISHGEWEKLYDRASKLKPPFRSLTSPRNSARVWIARNAKIALDALWDADYERAKKLLHKGGRSTSALFDARRECRNEQKAQTGNMLVIKARSIDKRHDWKTVK